MPAWNPKANDIFLSALEIDALAQRQAFIEQACGGDEELLAQIASLLAASQKAGSFLEKPPSGGVSVYRESMVPDPALLSQSLALVKRLGWQGVCMVEYKVESSTGTPYLMEVPKSPRSTCSTYTMYCTGSGRSSP